MIGIVDYGAGNLASVKKAFDHLSADCRLVRSEKEMAAVDRLVLPGVGAFGAAVENLRRHGVWDGLQLHLERGRPLLGICLGMQLLFEDSRESPGASGLGFFSGGVERFRLGKVPQIGWNRVVGADGTELFLGLPGAPYFYFVHGYHVVPRESGIIIARTTYGLFYPSVVRRDAVLGVQFHPEKSGACGLQLLENWRKSC